MGFTMAEMARFWDRGYVIRKSFISPNVCDNALEEVRHLEYHPIFRKVYSKTDDAYRSQVDLLPLGNSVERIHDLVASIVEDTNVRWEVRDSSWHALKSLAGDRSQAVHQDFPSFEIARAVLKHYLVQGSLIVALMDDTYLHVYPGCLGGQAEKSKRVTLTLQQGDVLFFRGDLAHAGAKYCKENIRLHCYARVRGVSQKKNATEAVIFKTFRCSKCMAGAYSLKKLAAHKRECAVDSACKCPYCPESYDKPNSLTKHITRKHRSVHKGRSRRQTSNRCEEANEDSEKDVDMVSEEEDEGSEISEDEESEDDMSEEDEASENSEENDSGDSDDDEVSEESEESEESESDAED